MKRGYIGPAFLTLFAAMGVSSAFGDRPISNLRSDERIVFLTTDARIAQDGTWRIPVHAWVHELESSLFRRRAIAFALKRNYGLEATAMTESNFLRRVGLLLVDNERGKRVVVRIGDSTFTLPPTTPNGHARDEFTLDAAAVSRAARGRSLTFTAVLPERDARSFTGTVQLVDPTGLSVISDIDDTVKVTEVTDRKAMFDRTFFRDFEAVAGMAPFYRSLADRGATFHFVSSSPWHLYEPLDEFLTASGFPPRSLALKMVRLKDRTVLDLFKKGTATKPLQIEPILQAFPGRRFLLIGDSGEQDPEVYAAIAKKYPEQIERILIRNVTDAKPADARFQEAFAGIDAARWVLFTDPRQLVVPDFP